MLDPRENRGFRFGPPDRRRRRVTGSDSGLGNWGETGWTSEFLRLCLPGLFGVERGSSLEQGGFSFQIRS